MKVVAELLMIAGAIFALIAGIGVTRFDDVYTRMHAAAKGPTLALLLVAIGASIEYATLEAFATLVLVVVLQLLTAPVGAHMVARSIHRRGGRQVDAVDQLAEAEAGEEHDAGRPGTS